jgi:mgtE-like transporter
VHLRWCALRGGDPLIYRWRSIVKHGLPLLTLCMVVEMIAGQRLQMGQEELLAVPIFLISIPVINGVGGNIGSILGARLASGLHVGYIQPQIRDKHLRDNVLAALLLGVCTYLVLAILIYSLSTLASQAMGVDVARFIIIMVITGFLLVCVLTVVSVATAMFSFKHGVDPDDMVSPVVTTIGDMLGILFLFVFIGVL